MAADKIGNGGKVRNRIAEQVFEDNVVRTTPFNLTAERNTF
jgi:hypothetical protein